MANEDYETPNPNGPKSTKTPLAPKGNSVVSDYLGYGSYNGSDIKVVVHLPRDPSREQEVSSKIKDTNAEINSILDSLGVDTGPEEQRRLLDSFDASNMQFEALNKELQAIKDLPTTKVLGEIQTFSWSVFREKSPVRTLGSVYPKTFVRGPRTIGGSMIFTIFHQHVLHELLDLNMRYYSTGTGDFDKYQYSTNLPDQLPPFDVTLLFANEYGAISYMGIYGIEFVQEGGTFSIEDIFSESVVQYVARDIDPLRTVMVADRNSQGVTTTYKTASALSSEKDVAKRRNMFI
jgi:hypothetical protein